MAGGPVAKIEVSGRWPLVQTPGRMVLDLEVYTQLCQPAAVSPSDVAHHFPRLVGHDAAENGDAAFNDARLLRGDGRQGRPQLLDVIEADTSDERNQGRADVGRIEPAAESHFEHGHVHLPAEKVTKGSRGEDSK